MSTILVLPQLSHLILEMNTYEHGEKEARGTPPGSSPQTGSSKPRGKACSPLIGVDLAASHPGVVPRSACGG